MCHSPFRVETISRARHKTKMGFAVENIHGLFSSLALLIPPLPILPFPSPPLHLFSAKKSELLSGNSEPGHCAGWLTFPAQEEEQGWPFCVGDPDIRPLLSTPGFPPVNLSARMVERTSNFFYFVIKPLL